MRYTIELTKHSEKCTNWLYSLYVNDIFICSFFCLDICFLKLEELIKKGVF